LRRPAVHRRPNVNPSEGQGCCCAPSRSQQRCSWSSPHRLITPAPDPRCCSADLAVAARSGCRPDHIAAALITPPPALSACDTWHPRSCPVPGGGSQSRGDTWYPQSCPTPGGGSRSRGDTWRPRSYPTPGGVSRSCRDTWHPRSCPTPGGGYHTTAPSFVPFRGWSGCGAVPIKPPLLLPGRHPTQVAPPLHDFNDQDHLDLSYLGIKGLSSACGAHRFLLQSQDSRYHDVTTAGGCQFIRFYLRLILQSHRLWCSRCGPQGNVRVYLVGYILCIIDCHICQDIFGRIDIMYCRLPYVSKGALPLRTLVLYIYWPRGTMQYNQQLYAIYSSYTYT
jgi:hypothetical protein